MRRFLPRLITLCAIAALLPGLAACVNSSKDDPGDKIVNPTSVSSSSSTQSPDDIASYWTEERMASAEPMPMPTISCRTKLQCLLDEWW